MTEDEKQDLEQRAKMLAKVVCICKGITLRQVLKGLEGSETVADVNRKVGTGSGGCGGERCGPRIKMLLKKKKEAQENKSEEKKVEEKKVEEKKVEEKKVEEKKAEEK